MTKWFSFDGCYFETHATPFAAKTRAERAMDDWLDDAARYGWDDAALQVCWGRVDEHAEVTHSRLAQDGDINPDGAGIVEEHVLVPQHVDRDEKDIVERVTFSSLGHTLSKAVQPEDVMMADIGLSLCEQLREAADLIDQPPKDMPRRVQRKRTKGYRLPPNTVSVCRPGKFGNPFKTSSAFRDWLCDKGGEADRKKEAILDGLGSLRGKNLACWCKLDEPCHADVLLELANGRRSHSRGNGVNPKSAMVGRESGSRQNASFSAAVNEIVDRRNARTVWRIP